MYHIRKIVTAAVICCASLAAAAPHHVGARDKHHVGARDKQDVYAGYLFAYFTGNTKDGEKIRFAVSKGNNALSWTHVNRGRPVLTSTKGTGGVRDPSIIRSQDGSRFWLVATDLSIGSGTSWTEAVHHGSHHLEIWESTDLVNWGEQRHVLVSPDNAGMTWAPDALWDPELGAYVVHWASSLYDPATDPKHEAHSYHRIMYATTTDFVTFSPAKVWQDTGSSRIDTAVTRVGDTYYRFTKDEACVATANGTGCHDVFQERSTRLLAPASEWTTMAAGIGHSTGTKEVEGPIIFRANPGDVHGDKYYLFVDEYGDRGYVALETPDISKPKWTLAPSSQLPNSPRHGGILPITQEQMEALKSKHPSSGRRWPHPLQVKSTDETDMVVH